MKILKTHIFPVLMLLSVFTVYSQNLPSFTTPDSDTLTWKDAQGVHLLLLEQSELFTDEETGLSSQNIQAIHWLNQENEKIYNWSYKDIINECPVDLEMKFLAAPQFSDLDDDGIYEIWMITQKSCKGDVSPSVIQVIMVDHKKAKFFLEAEQKLVFPNGSIDGGTYELGDFEELPKSFQDYALKYLFENYEYKY